MAIIVPKVERPSVAQAALPGARVTTGAPSGAFDSGMGTLNKAAQALFAEEKQRADATAFYQADLEASKLQSQIENRYKTERVGSAAMGASQDADVEFEKESAKIRANLSTEQQALFDRSVSQRRGSLYGVLEHHATAERKKYDGQVLEEYAKEAQKDIISNASMYSEGDPAVAQTADENIAIAIDRQVAAINKMAADNHYDQKWIDNRSAEARAAAHRQVIDVLLSEGKDMLAQDYYDIHKDSITGFQDVEHVNKALREGTYRGESQRQYDMLMQSGEDWKDRYAKADTIEDPTVRAKTKELLDSQRNREKSMQAEQADANFTGGAADAERAGTVNAIDPSIWASYTPAQRTAIEQRLKHVKEGTEPPMNYQVWTDFTFMDPKELAKLTASDMMLKLRPNLDDQHYDAALRQLEAAKAAAAKGPAGLSAMQSDSDIVKNAWLEYKDKPEVKDLDDDGKKGLMQFSDKASTEVQKYEMNNGRKATDAEKQDIVRNILKNQVFINRNWRSDPEIPAKLVNEDERGAAYVPMANIPPVHRRTFVNWARSQGIIPQNASQSDAESFLGDRLERAYGVGAVGGSDESWMAILRDGPKMLAKRQQTSAGLIKRN